MSLRRNIRTVVVCKRRESEVLTAVLFSADTTLSAENICRYYTARFQIGFLFRDAKQFTGLTDFQTRSESRIVFHVNASLTALNFPELEDRQQTPEHGNHVISVTTRKVRKFNEHQLERIISILGFDLNSIQLHPHYEDLINYGTIAA